MSDEAIKILDDLDWAEKVVRRRSVEAAEGQRALTQAVDERAIASRRVAAMIKANHSSAISWNGGTYVLREHDVVERVPTVIVHDCAVPKAEPVNPEGEFVLRRWQATTDRFSWVAFNAVWADVFGSPQKQRAMRFQSIEQAEGFRAKFSRWASYEVARFDDPVGPPIDAETEERTAEQIIEAVNGRDMTDAEIDTDAAAYAAVEKVFGEAHGLGSDKGAS